MADQNSLAFNYLGSSKSIDAQSTTQEYHIGELIFDQGDKADAIFYIQNGNAKLTVVSKSGKKAVIAILRQGDFFGEGCLTRRSLRTSSATAIRPSTITRVERSKMVRILQKEPTFAKLFTAHLLFRIGRIEEDLVDQVCNTSEKRLARLLLILTDFGRQAELEPGIPKVNQETLAEMVGTTRSRISYFMNRFRKRGYIDYNGSLHVHKALETFLFDG
ncbi:MAG: Crp/Fnr family transcriptional regulator [Candidatus Korobacteraceae bacterium]